MARFHVRGSRKRPLCLKDGGPLANTFWSNCTGRQPPRRSHPSAWAPPPISEAQFEPRLPVLPSKPRPAAGVVGSALAGRCAPKSRDGLTALSIAGRNQPKREVSRLPPRAYHGTRVPTCEGLELKLGHRKTSIQVSAPGQWQQTGSLAQSQRSDPIHTFDCSCAPKGFRWWEVPIGPSWT